jgi:outer membrane protein OmpA-like peptidoglycan-associated protein
MKNRVTFAEWSTIPELRPPMGEAFHKMSADSLGDGAESVRLCESWRAWEASSSSEFLNWLLFTAHERSSATGISVLEDWICFKDDRTELDDRARAVLGERLKVFRENPAMRIVIGGLAGQPSTIAHGMRLGLRRVLAIRSFLLTNGIDPDRIGIALRGSGWWVSENFGEAERLPSAAGECRIQLTDPNWTLSRN